MTLAEDERLPSPLDSFHVASQNRVARIRGLQNDLVGFEGQFSADSQPYQIIGRRQFVRFSEIVDASNQAVFLVSPSPEIVQMQIAYRSAAGDRAKSAHTTGHICIHW